MPKCKIAELLTRQNIYNIKSCCDYSGPVDQRKIAAFARQKPWVQIPPGPLNHITNGPLNHITNYPKVGFESVTE